MAVTMYSAPRHPVQPAYRHVRLANLRARHRPIIGHRRERQRRDQISPKIPVALPGKSHYSYRPFFFCLNNPHALYVH